MLHTPFSMQNGQVILPQSVQLLLAGLPHIEHNPVISILFTHHPRPKPTLSSVGKGVAVIANPVCFTSPTPLGVGG